MPLKIGRSFCHIACQRNYTGQASLIISSNEISFKMHRKKTRRHHHHHRHHHGRCFQLKSGFLSLVRISILNLGYCQKWQCCCGDYSTEYQPMKWHLSIYLMGWPQLANKHREFINPVTSQKKKKHNVIQYIQSFWSSESLTVQHFTVRHNDNTQCNDFEQRNFIIVEHRERKKGRKKINSFWDNIQTHRM